MILGMNKLDLNSSEATVVVMRLLFLGVLFSIARSANLPGNCQSSYSADEGHVTECFYNTSVITYKWMKNQHVDVFCDEDTYTCEDLDRFVFGSNQSLPKLSMTHCPPHLLQCINDIIYATSSEEVLLQQQSGSLTKEDVAYLGNVTVLHLFRAGKQTSLPLETIKSLPTLRSFRMNGAHSVQLPSEGWGGTPPLTYLELSDTHLELRELPPDSFRGLDELQHLSFSGNKIQRIADGAFEGLPSLHTLSFNDNNVSSIAPGALSSLLQLRTLDLGNNELEELPEELLDPLVQLLELQLYHNKLSQLPPKLFRRVSAVTRLHLDHNQLSHLSEELFTPLKSLQHLNLNNNRITSLPENLFTGLTALQEVYFDHNRIMFIHSKAFIGPTGLSTVSLAHNQLTLDHSDKMSPFEGLEFVKVINLAGNQISQIEDFRFYLNKLELLDLSYNNFTEIIFDPKPEAPFMTNSATVDLRHNQIRRIHMTVLPNIHTNSPLLLLDHNPIDCDCYMFTPRLKVDEDIKNNNKPIIDFGNANCATPKHLQDTPITKIELNDLICNISRSEDNCTTLVRPDTNELLIHCPVLPASLPETTDENIIKYFTKKPTINLKLNKQPDNLKDLDIHTLNLTNINIENIKFKPTEHLKVLDVSNNKITNVPKDFLKANIHVILLNNSLDCSCDQYDVIKEVKHSKYVHKATCSDGQDISNIDLNTLCNTRNALLTGVLTFASAALLVIATSYFIHKYYQRILIWMITNKVFKDFAKEIVQDKDKTYDIFVSYCEADATTVERDLVLKLENDFEQNVCVHTRDWDVGAPIPTSIQDSVEQSRRTVIFLSNKYLDSYWGNMEFSTAHGLAKKEQRIRLILIIAEESVLNSLKISKELKAYIDNNTYLMYKDNNFDKKLERSLPKKQYAVNWSYVFCRDDNVIKDDSVVKEETTKQLGLDVQINNDGKLENVVKKDDDGKPENYV